MVSYQKLEIKSCVLSTLLCRFCTPYVCTNIRFFFLEHEKRLSFNTKIVCNTYSVLKNGASFLRLRPSSFFISLFCSFFFVAVFADFSTIWAKLNPLNKLIF